MFIIVLLIVNVILSHLVGKSGERREIGYTTSFVLSFLFSPIIGLLFVMASLPLPLQPTTQLKFPKTDKVDNKKNNWIGVYFVIFIILFSMCYYFNKI